MKSRTYTYDSLKRLVQAVNPESGTITYSYDTSGNLSTRTHASSTVLTFAAYDGMNRATGKSYVPGTGVASTPSVSYTYGDAQTSCNLRGLLMQVTAGSTPSMVNNYTCYDWAGRPTSSNQVTGGQTHGMSYGYDLAGLMKSFTLPSGRQQTISYDIAGRASGVSGIYGAASTTYASAFSYFPNGALKNVSLGPNALYQQYCQDTSGRLQIVGIRLAAAGGGTTTNCGNGGDALNLAFSYGSAGYNNGNLTSETLLPLNVAQSFTYDAYNRLSQAAEGTAWSQTYKYDVTGNPNVSLGNRYVSASSGLGILPSSFTPTQNTNFDSNNRLIIQGSTYYNAGNLKTVGGYNFTYDAENREVSNTVNSAANSYYYDGEGRRVEKVTPSTTTVYVYDAKGEVAAEYATYPPGPPATLYPTADPLGSTRLTSNAAGTAMGYHDYLPFGEEIPSTVGGRGSLYGAPELTQKFTGKERDTETASSAMEGLDYFGARYFSGSMGRFTSPDWSASPEPVPYANLSDPQTLNLYGYVRDNPLNTLDIDGHGSCENQPGLCAAIRDAIAKGGSIQEGTAAYQLSQKQGLDWKEMTGKQRAAAFELVRMDVFDKRVKQTAPLLEWALVLGSFVGEGKGVLPQAGEASEVEAAASLTNPLEGLKRVGSALKTDPYHAFSDIIDNYASVATKTSLRPGVDIYQIEGSLGGEAGRFEWIVDQGKVTHRFFVVGGKVTGVPIKP